MLQALRNAIAAPVAVKENARTFERMLFVEPCRVTRWGKEYQATTRNISKGGLCLDIEGMGSDAYDVELSIQLRDFEPILATARWAHKRTFGVQFLTPVEDNVDLLSLLAELEAMR